MIAHTLTVVAVSFFMLTIILMKIIFIKFLLTALLVIIIMKITFIKFLLTALLDIILMKIIFVKFLLTALLVIIARHAGFAVASLAVTPTVF